MKRIIALIIACFSLLTLASCNNKNNNNQNNPPVDESNRVHLVVLAGQSGARGKALVDDLDIDDRDPNPDVDILSDGLPMGALGNIPGINESLYIEPLEPGYGDFPSEFGPELGMGQTLASAYPKTETDYKTVIVKYTASGSTFTDHWYSTSLINDDDASEYLNLEQITETAKGAETGPLTNNLYALVDKAIADLTDYGYDVVIDGMAFVHGEQDAKFDENMEIYEKALTCFINDFRAYFGDEDMPVVITEALTNSAKYSNTLRSIQNKVAASMYNVSLVETSDLYTNTFEPWHFGAESNNILGNRIAAELISYNDIREIKSIDTGVINVPYGAEVTLPAYLKASFTNMYSGYVKALNYTTYDCNKLGEQNVTVQVNTSNGVAEHTVKVNVTENIAHVDGQLNEYAGAKKNLLPDDLGELYVVKGQQGLYIATKINDTELWTDGENWHKGDMGQNGFNDDFVIYITDSTAEARKALCLSAANLLRVYEGDTIFDDTDIALPFDNMIYTKVVSDYAYHVTTNGLANCAESEGMVLELYISYEDLEIEDPDDIKLCFNYSNITSVSGEKTAENNYFTKNTSGNEESIDSYFSIGDLIN